jgi:hypothetical protein
MKWKIAFILLPLFWLSCIPLEKEYTEYRRSFEERHSVKPGYTLFISSRDGNIRIENWEQSTVEIKGEMSVWVDSEETAEKEFGRRKVRKHANKISLTYTPSKSRERKLIYKRIDYQIMTPRNTHLELDIDDGTIEIIGLEGSIKIKGDDIDGVITGGRNLELKSDDGEIELAELKGEIEIDTEDTDIFFRSIDSQKITISTDDGSIEGELRIRKDGDYAFTTDDGNIIIRLPKDSATKVLVEKDDGNFETDFPFLLKRTFNHNSIEGIINREEASTVICTDDGDIIIEAIN